DGLWDVYNNFHMGSAAEIIADRFNFSRQQLDEYALGSYDRALNAQKNGYFNEEIIQIDISTKKEIPKFLKDDEEPKKLNREKLTRLQPAFKEDGKLTAGNSSSISDGAAAVVLTSEAKAKKLGIRPFAKILGYSESGLSPELFSLAPINSIEDVLKKTKLTISDIDLFEINEAFASSSLAVNKELNLDPKKVNISGGAIAMGHPIGASGARILTTLLYNLKRTQGKHGIASLCIGGGEAVAMAVESL
ncbi:MAG: thiolase family protein, partial [Candidatus Scalindua sediminis]